MKSAQNPYSKSARRLSKIHKAMGTAETYDEWKTLALEHDRLSGAAEWKETEQTTLYDHNNIRTRLDKLRNLRYSKNDRGLLFSLNEGIHGNMGGMGKPVLHSRAKVGTKKLIEEYVQELSEALKHFSPKRFKGIPFKERQDFFMRASHCYGRSALMLSGGGALGHFHLGVIKVLIQQELLPTVISGSSAGAFVAAMIGTHTQEEMLTMFEDGSLLKRISAGAGKFKLHLTRGELEGLDEVEKGIARVIPNMTFQEAYDKTGRAINISVSGAEPQQTSRLLNAITSPNVLIRSAVLASCAIPGVFPPVVLKAKNDTGRTQAYLPSRRWIDGSFSQDLPAKRLTRLYGVNHFIVSQVNPAVLPIINDPKLESGLIGSIVQTSMSFSKSVIRGSLNLLHRHVPVSPRVAVTLSTMHALIDQEYTGDINIFPNFRYFNPKKLISAISEEEIAHFMSEGERCTWPKVESIRTNTLVGRTLDDILAKLDRRGSGSVSAKKNGKNSTEKTPINSLDIQGVPQNRDAA